MLPLPPPRCDEGDYPCCEVRSECDNICSNLVDGDWCKTAGACAPGKPPACAFPEDAGCPVAGCAAPPAGCRYVFDFSEINPDGTCCPRLCYAEDEDGRECSVSAPWSENEEQSSVGGRTGGVPFWLF